MEPIRCFFIEPTGRSAESGVDIYRRLDTGEEMTLSSAPVGAMWYADWYLPERFGSSSGYVHAGPDGHVLVVKTPPAPGRDWIVDSRCSNCDMPDDSSHSCWVRHGDPRTGLVTVDKNGNTCHAGAGSIGVWNRDRTGYIWHGFLRNGFLVE